MTFDSLLSLLTSFIASFKIKMTRNKQLAFPSVAKLKCNLEPVRTKTSFISV